MIDTVSGTGMQTRADLICKGSQSSFVGEEFNLGRLDLVVEERSLGETSLWIYNQVQLAQI